jgi:hypothetical protein
VYQRPKASALREKPQQNSGRGAGKSLGVVLGESGKGTRSKKKVARS